MCFDNCSRHLLLHLPRSKLLVRIGVIWSVDDKTKKEKNNKTYRTSSRDGVKTWPGEDVHIVRSRFCTPGPFQEVYFWGIPFCLPLPELTVYRFRNVQAENTMQEFRTFNRAEFILLRYLSLCLQRHYAAVQPRHQSALHNE